MTARSPSAFLMSASMHGAIAIVLLLVSYALKPQAENAPKVFELVAGEGDNYMATAAPALGTPGGVKVSLPEPPAPKIAPVPVQPAAAPVIESAPPPKPVEKIPDFSRTVKRTVATKVRKAQREIAAEKRAEARRAKEAAERRAKEAEKEAKRITKAEFDRMHTSSAKAAPRSTRSTKVRHIDAEGIAKGVIGGSIANKAGGAGGTALTREEGDAIDAYTALLAQKIKSELDEHPGVGAGLIVEVELRIMADGSLRNITITKSSGSSDFDQAVREALGKIQLPPRPPGLKEFQRFPIRGVAED